MARIRGWIVTQTDAMDPRGQGPTRVVFDTEEEAIQAAGEAAVALAKEDLTGLDWEGNEPEVLHEIVRAGERGDWRAAFDGWHEYQQDMSHDSKLEVEPT